MFTLKQLGEAPVVILVFSVCVATQTKMSALIMVETRAASS